MESNNIKSQIMQRLAVYTALALLIWGGLSFFFSPVARAVAEREDKSINFLVLTQQPMFISYNPKAKKAIVNIINPSKKNNTLQDVLNEAKISYSDFVFIAPHTQERNAFWDKFKDNLHLWRLKPYLVFMYFYDYIHLRKEHRTDISADDFIVLSMDLSGLTPADFSVINRVAPAPVKRRKQQDQAAAQPQITLAQNIQQQEEQQKTIVIEIFNASDKSGLASEVTRYLRQLNNEGKLNLDVISYSNAPAAQDHTEIINNTGNLEDLKNICLYLNLGDQEILSKSDKIAISDAKIILGRDFVLPKNLNK